MQRFESLTDFLAAVAGAADMPNAMDDRLRNFVVPAAGYQAAATGSTSSIPSEGGFAVPDEFVDPLWESTYSTGSLLSLCDKLTMRSGKLKVPAIGDNDRTDGNRFGGLSMSWLEPGDEIPATKPDTRRIEFTARRLAGLTWSTDELIADAPAWEATLRRLYGLESSHRIEQEIVDGEGIKGPLGILNSGALITVEPESGQVAGTVRAENLTNMWSRLWSASRRRAVWLVNDDVEAQLALASLGSGTALSKIIDYQGGGMTALGRPVLSLEQCPALGSLGDVILCDPSQYIIAERSTRAQSSVHVRFLYGESAFRFSVRMDGQPAWSSTITPKNAVATQSPFVALAAR
jgi:HK97 family phage major capsid protein